MAPINPTTAASSFADHADDLYKAVTDNFSIPSMGLMAENSPPKDSDQGVAFLWPYSGMLSAVVAMMEVPGQERVNEPRLAEILAGLAKYWDSVRTPPAYEALPAEVGGSDRFYDDNAWIALDYVALYHLTGREEYLSKAKTLFDFDISGWSQELGGGIYWCEQKRQTKNTCSNGPNAILALELYLATDDPQYLSWGERIYTWTHDHLRSPNGVYWDHMRGDGSIDKATYTYNTGTMLQSAVLLYRITKTRSYLQEAQTLARAAYDHFTHPGPEGIRFYPRENPWFTSVLYRAYLALYRVDGNPVYVDSVITDIRYAWDHARLKNGLVGRDWSGETRQEHQWLLDEAAMIEILARSASFERSLARS